MILLSCLAVIIGGAVVGLLFAVTLVMFIVYRMRKKDEGSYALDEPKASPTVGYTKTRDREFFAWSVLRAFCHKSLLGVLCYVVYLFCAECFIMFQLPIDAAVWCFSDCSIPERVSLEMSVPRYVIPIIYSYQLFLHLWYLLHVISDFNRRSCFETFCYSVFQY